SVCFAPVIVPGGNPVTAVPELTPRSPVTVVCPVLVTVEPARTAKLAADSKLTSVRLQWAPPSVPASAWVPLLLPLPVSLLLPLPVPLLLPLPVPDEEPPASGLPLPAPLPLEQAAAHASAVPEMIESAVEASLLD